MRHAHAGRGWIVALWRLQVLLCACAWLCARPSHARADDTLGFAVVRHDLPTQLCAGEKINVAVELRNDGMVPWSSALGDRLAYHWLRDAEVVVREGRRTGVGGMVMPGASTELRARVDAPEQAGRYTLQWAMVRDRVRWFAEPDDARVEIEVVDGGAPLAWSAVLLGPATIAARETSELRVRVHNHGCATWSADRGDAMAYHWLDAAGNVVVREGMRTPMPELRPGESAELRVRVEGPRSAGAHVLQLEPVREHASWYGVGSSRVDLQACKLEYSIVSPK